MFNGFRFTSREKAGCVYLVVYYRHRRPTSPTDAPPAPELRHSVVVDVSGESDDAHLMGKELTIGHSPREAWMDGNLSYTKWPRSELISYTLLGRLPFPPDLDNPDDPRLITPIVWARRLDETAEAVLEAMAQQQGSRRWTEALNSRTFAQQLSIHLVGTPAMDLLSCLPAYVRDHDRDADGSHPPPISSV